MALTKQASATDENGITIRFIGFDGRQSQVEVYEYDDGKQQTRFRAFSPMTWANQKQRWFVLDIVHTFAQSVRIELSEEQLKLVRNHIAAGLAVFQVFDPDEHKMATCGRITFLRGCYPI